MASTLDQAFATNMLKSMLGLSGYTAPTAPVQVALMTAQGSATANGTEVTGGSYARQNLGAGTPATGSASNAATINFTNMPAVTVNAIELWDSAATKARLSQGALTTPRTTSSGDTISFNAAAIVQNLG